VRLDWDVDLDDVVVTVDGTEVYRSSQFRADVETISAVVDAINEHEEARIERETKWYKRQYLGHGGLVPSGNLPWRAGDDGFYPSYLVN
jgi:hypothetical protein